MKKTISYLVHVERETRKEAVVAIQIKGLVWNSQLCQKADKTAFKAVEVECTNKKWKK
ncbi:hypothetical protein ACRW9N_09345 [Listeria aquatica]|uniref:hypothetical protein n=1 Tax=Listeria aquatica TaxID=1494960 RepID=UPI0031F53D55